MKNKFSLNKLTRIWKNTFKHDKKRERKKLRVNPFPLSVRGYSFFLGGKKQTKWMKIPMMKYDFTNWKWPNKEKTNIHWQRTRNRRMFLNRNCKWLDVYLSNKAAARVWLKWEQSYQQRSLNFTTELLIKIKSYAIGYGNNNNNGAKTNYREMGFNCNAISTFFWLVRVM